MPAMNRATLDMDRRRTKLALLVMLAAGGGLSACNAESLAGPSKFSEPAGEIGGGLIDEIGAPRGPCLLLRTIPCR